MVVVVVVGADSGSVGGTIVVWGVVGNFVGIFVENFVGAFVGDGAGILVVANTAIVGVGVVVGEVVIGANGGDFVGVVVGVINRFGISAESVLQKLIWKVADYNPSPLTNPEVA